MKKIGLSIILVFFLGMNSLSAEKLEIPNHVVSIEKENTSQQMKEEEAIVEPSKFVKELIDNIDIKIENPDLIKMLNETDINPSPIAIGYRGNVYLGHWPLRYDSSDSKVNWEFQLINTNEANNYNGEKNIAINYEQLEEKHIKGGLTSKVSHPEQIMKMIINSVEKKHAFPLTFHAVFGKGTRLSQTYDVPLNKVGALKAYASALQERGQITFGEVYIELKGSKRNLVIKNVTKQDIGAFIPVENHVAFSYKTY
ncbi:YfkD-like protein [Gracilibacillus ureilyticus]|uniref:YfkD-like protein n=1 Tax=Gracilibacillus ureilyticus TaxID=531814 RepID=A0A1H9QBY7_9BACI|nr:YfkD family protein [Gracilibacillus ureilyticus]SER57928.1 YfkD-like protein [Gracilibacillus ureilyticus]